MNKDTLQEALLLYMQQRELQWGIYLATIQVKSSLFCFKVAFEFDIEHDKDDVEKAHEYVFIFQGKRRGIFVGDYDIINIEFMQEY